MHRKPHTQRIRASIAQASTRAQFHSRTETTLAHPEPCVVRHRGLRGVRVLRSTPRACDNNQHNKTQDVNLHGQRTNIPYARSNVTRVRRANVMHAFSLSLSLSLSPRVTLICITTPLKPLHDSKPCGGRGSSLPVELGTLNPRVFKDSLKVFVAQLLA